MLKYFPYLNLKCFQTSKELALLLNYSILSVFLALCLGLHVACDFDQLFIHHFYTNLCL